MADCAVGGSAREGSARNWRKPVLIVRYGGRCTSSWKRSLDRESSCRRTGRFTARAATSSSTPSTTCSWTPETPQQFTRLYYDWGEVDPIFAVTVYQKKTLTLQVALSSELQMLAFQLDRLAQKNRWSRDFTFHSLRDALREIVAFFPVYRSYISEEGVSDRDRRYVIAAVNRAKRGNPAITALLFHFVRDMLLLHYPETATEEERAEQRRFAGKFQQVTAPVMAKGVEDTAFYIYNRLASLNEVGGDPSQFGAPPS